MEKVSARINWSTKASGAPTKKTARVSCTENPVTKNTKADSKTIKKTGLAFSTKTTSKNTRGASKPTANGATGWHFSITGSKATRALGKVIRWKA